MVELDGDLTSAAGTIENRVRRVLSLHSGLGEAAERLGPHQSLWSAGMDSLASVRVMLAVEEEFAIEFPEEALTRETFGSVASIVSAVHHQTERP